MNILKRSDAMRLGLKQYFTGKPCPKGHISNRYVNGKGCVACASANRKLWEERNKEYALQRGRNWHKKNRSENRDALLEQAREYRVKNGERIRELARARYKSNRDRVLSQVRDYASRNREQVRAKNKLWRENNRELVATLDRLKRDRRKGAVGSHTVDDIREIERLQRNRCAYCKCDLRKLKRHIDHIVPISRGGTNDRANLQLLCEFCNLSKHARDPIDFAQSRGLLL